MPIPVGIIIIGAVCERYRNRNAQVLRDNFEPNSK